MLWQGVVVAAVAVNEPLPDFYFVLVDDLGVGGIGYNNGGLKAMGVTPHLDALAASGVKMTAHYTYKYCSPTRGSFLTSRLPYRLGASNHNAAPSSSEAPLLKMKFLTERLKAKGYKSMQVPDRVLPYCYLMFVFTQGR